MGNNRITVRAKRWVKFAKNYMKEKSHGLDFSIPQFFCVSLQNGHGIRLYQK